MSADFGHSPLRVEWSDGRSFVSQLLDTRRDLLRVKVERVAENAQLRQQVIVLRCSAKQTKFTGEDRYLTVLPAN